MKKNSIFILIAAAILIVGIFCAGCTDSGSSSGSTVQPQSTVSANAEKPTKPSSSASTDQAKPSKDGQQVNKSGGPAGAPPSGVMMNGTRPSGNPPSGTPPSGKAMNSTRPSGTPPPGDQQSSGTPPSGPPPTGQ